MRGVAFGPGLSSKCRAMVVENARVALGVDARWVEVRMLFFQAELNALEGLIVIVYVRSVDTMRKSSKSSCYPNTGWNW